VLQLNYLVLFKILFTPISSMKENKVNGLRIVRKFREIGARVDIDKFPSPFAEKWSDRPVPNRVSVLRDRDGLIFDVLINPSETTSMEATVNHESRTLLLSIGKVSGGQDRYLCCVRSTRYYLRPLVDGMHPDLSKGAALFEPHMGVGNRLPKGANPPGRSVLKSPESVHSV